MGFFDDILTDSERVKKNYYAPDIMKMRDKFNDMVLNLKDVMVLDCAILRVDYNKDPKNNYEVRVDENGNPIMTILAYVGYNDTKYFQTNSRYIVNQLMMIWERENNKNFMIRGDDGKLSYPPMGDYEVKAVKGYKCVIAPKPQEYKKGEFHDTPILKDVEE